MFKIFSIDGSLLANGIAEKLDCELGNFKVDKFSDGELSPQFEETVRDKKVFLVGSTINSETIMTMLLSIDAAKRANASEIIAVIPYFGYSRQDRKEGSRGAIGARLMANLLEAAGTTKVISIDLHSEQIQGFFNIPVNMIPGSIVFSQFTKTLQEDDYCICSPDAGGVKRAMRYYQRFLRKFPNASFAMLSKIRTKPNVIERMDLIGDVSGKHVILIDDMIDTAGTITKAAELIKSGGATRVTALAAHGVLSGLGKQRIQTCEYLDQLVISDSISQAESNKIKVVSCVPALAVAIDSIVNKKSMDEHLEKI